MIPHHIQPSPPSSYTNPAMPSSLPVQPSQASTAIPNDLNHQFTLVIPGIDGQPHGASESIVVPPRRRDGVDSLPDTYIIKALRNIVNNPSVWKVEGRWNGERVLTYTRKDSQQNPRSPVVTLCIDSNQVLQSFEMRSRVSTDANENYVVNFFGPALPHSQATVAAPTATRAQQAPVWLLEAFNNAQTLNKRRITPPRPPTPTRHRSDAGPSMPLTHAAHLSADEPSAADKELMAARMSVQAPQVPRADGLYVEDQPQTSRLYTSQDWTVVNTCASHALNQAFQGNTVGIALQGSHLTEIQQFLNGRGILMDDVDLILNPGEEARAGADLQGLAQRLEYSGTAIVEVGGQEFRQAVTQHFVTLVRHGRDGRVYVLDSMNPQANIHFETARDALQAYLRPHAEGNRHVAVLMPRQGHVLPPALSNPQGAYVPNQGFVPLDDLSEGHLDLVEIMHGNDARGRLYRAIVERSQARRGTGERHWGDSFHNATQSNVYPLDDPQTQGVLYSTPIRPQQYLEMSASATGRTSDQGLATGSNNVMCEAQIGYAQGMSQSRQTAAGLQDPRNALMAHLAHQKNYRHGALATLTFAELNESNWDDETRGLIDA
ncbi:hypothetical protein RY831_31315, partial [Noviherbaspirillum sp. CPCC 100848]